MEYNPTLETKGETLLIMIWKVNNLSFSIIYDKTLYHYLIHVTGITH